MPSVEKRLESIEEDLKLVKAEIKHTLVDLRAVVMQADGPFREAPRIARRNNEQEVHEIQASASKDGLEDPEKGGAALPAGPAPPPPEEVGLQPSPDGIAQEEAYTGQEHTISPTSLDVNLIASLVRWVSIAQQRLGIQYLDGFLELYIKATNGSPVVKEIIMYISTMLGNNEVSQDGNPRESNVAQERNDLMLQLHGILTAHSATSNYSKFRPEGSMEEDEVEKYG